MNQSGARRAGRNLAARGLPAAAARDCLVITKALVEADAGVSHKPPPDLKDRIVRALLGYLTAPPAN